ncbi:MAG: HEAT repeat domain-containing protein [Planctomycetota bacterium]|nr:MAG: HEAT repeat domain-containing protein [Planctomycetota bacterium]
MCRPGSKRRDHEVTKDTEGVASMNAHTKPYLRIRFIRLTAALCTVLAAAHCYKTLHAADSEEFALTDADFSAERVAELRELLSDESPRTRGEAAEQLAIFGPEARSAVPELIQLLGDPGHYRGEFGFPYDVNNRAAWALEAIGSEGVHALAIRFPEMPSDQQWQAAYVAWILETQAREIIPLVIDRFKSSETEARQRGYYLSVVAMCDPDGRVAVPLLIAGFDDEDVDVRETSAAWLGRWTHFDPFGERAPPAKRWFADPERDTNAVVDVLISAMDDESARVRGFAARSLGTYPEAAPRAIPVLFAALDDDEIYWFAGSNHTGSARYVANDAVYALANYTDHAVEVSNRLVEYASDPNSPAQDAALDSLTRLAEFNPDIVDSLMTVLEDELELQIREDESPHITLRYITQLGPKAARAAPRIRELLEREDLELQDEAVAALICVLGDDAQDALMILENHLQNGGGYSWYDLRAGGRFAAPAVPILREYLQQRTESGELQSVDSNVFYTAEALGPDGIELAPYFIEVLGGYFYNPSLSDALVNMGPGVVPLSGTALEDDQRSPQHHGLVLQTLSHFGADAAPALDSVLLHVESPHPRVREVAVQCLAAIGDSPEICLPVLSGAVNDPRPFVRAATADALARFPDDVLQTLPLLMALLADDYLGVQVAAAGALERIGPPAEGALPRLKEVCRSEHVLLQQTAQAAIDAIEHRLTAR